MSVGALYSLLGALYSLSGLCIVCRGFVIDDHLELFRLVVNAHCAMGNAQSYWILLNDCLLIALDAHIFSHDG